VIFCIYGCARRPERLAGLDEVADGGVDLACGPKVVPPLVLELHDEASKLWYRCGECDSAGVAASSVCKKT
jgi:hypothetical protein